MFEFPKLPVPAAAPFGAGGLTPPGFRSGVAEAAREIGSLPARGFAAAGPIRMDPAVSEMITRAAGGRVRDDHVIEEADTATTNR